MDNVKDILQSLTSISAPSGYEMPVVHFLKDMLSIYSNLKIEEDILGNLIVTKKGKTAKTIMLVAHCDEIGFAVKYIDEHGFIRFAPIGGVDVSLLKGQIVNIVHNDTIIQGVVGARPIHFSYNEENTKSFDISDMWIDIGAQDKESAMDLVSIGDPITFNTHYTELDNHLFSAKSVDNRVGVAVLLSVIQQVHALDIDSNIVFVFSVQEEIGLRGAIAAGYVIHPDINIVVDVTHATDYPTANRNAFGDIRLGNGPVIPIGANFSMKIQNMLKFIAEKEGVPYQFESMPGNSGTDAAALQILRGGGASGLLSIPCRYMHTPVEIISYQDLRDAINILISYVIHSPNFN